MSDLFLDESRYKFVTGRGDDEHENRLNQAAAKGYAPRFMIYNPEGSVDNREVVVLMENPNATQRRSGM